MLEELARLLSSYIPPQSQLGRLTGWEDKETKGPIWNLSRMRLSRVFHGLIVKISLHILQTRHAEESGCI
jgi:hypothetical protein